MNKREITGYFEDEGNLKAAIKHLNEKAIPIKDVFTPFPVHGIEKLLKYKRSNIPKVGFWGGVLGATCGLSFQIWVFTSAYPLIFGGKPYLSLPSFIPVTFELTVLFASFSMVFAFLIRSKLGAGAKNKIYDTRVTDDRFLILLESSDNIELLKAELQASGAQGITEHDVDDQTIKS